MADANVLVLSGRLTKDSTLTKAGAYEICKFSMAVNGYKSDDVMFIDVNVWGKTAQALHSYLLKGKQIIVNGSLKIEKWDKNDGTTVSKIVCNANNITMLADSKGRMESKDEDPYEDDKDEVTF